MPDPATCPCGTTRPYTDCCRILHRGEPAATAEALMRSRYSAFATGEVDYLLGTWHPSTRPARLDADPDVAWTRLVITGSTGGALFHTTGTVSFAAHYQRIGVRGVQAETSRFVRENGRWYYVDGETDSSRS